MPVQVKGLAEFQRKVDAFSANAPKADVTVVNGVALASKQIVLSTASPKRLSRFANGKGVNLNVSYRLVPGPVPSAIVLPTPPGPWYLLERGGVKHTIGNRGSRRGARRGQPGFLGNRASGFAAFGPVEHPGSPAKRTWTKSVTPAIAGGRALYQRSVRKTYLSMFR